MWRWKNETLESSIWDAELGMKPGGIRMGPRIRDKTLGGRGQGGGSRMWCWIRDGALS